MTVRDYEISREIERTYDWGEDFYALVMVLMRHADTANQGKLRAAWPDVWAELEERYNAPAGLLVGEKVRRPEGDVERRANGIYVNGALVVASRTKARP
jgi:hypothetical protein